MEHFRHSLTSNENHRSPAAEHPERGLPPYSETPGSLSVGYTTAAPTPRFPLPLKESQPDIYQCLEGTYTSAIFPSRDVYLRDIRNPPLMVVKKMQRELQHRRRKLQWQHVQHQHAQQEAPWYVKFSQHPITPPRSGKGELQLFERMPPPAPSPMLPRERTTVKERQRHGRQEALNFIVLFRFLVNLMQHVWRAREGNTMAYKTIPVWPERCEYDAIRIWCIRYNSWWNQNFSSASHK